MPIISKIVLKLNEMDFANVNSTKRTVSEDKSLHRFKFNREKLYYLKYLFALRRKVGDVEVGTDGGSGLR